MCSSFRCAAAVFAFASRIALAITFAASFAPQVAAQSLTGCREVAPQSAQSQIAPRGIANFGQVSPTLFRGGQPSAEGYRELKQMGVEVVVSFRHERGENSLERREVEAQGMHFVSLPWHAWEIPADDDVRRFLGLLATNQNTKVFVHCQQGRDRTGTMVALYRVAVDHWCPASAVSEMKAYHYRHFFFPQLETYVEAFPQRLAMDSRLAGITPPSLNQR